MVTDRIANATGKRVATSVAAALMTLALAGCASDKLTTGSISRGSGTPATAMSSQQVGSQVERLGRSYAKNPKDMNTAMGYASVLQMDGRSDQALAVMRKLAIDYPQERQVLAAYGKALASAGELEPALDAVRRAQTPEYPDWKLLSAEAAILDQLGKPDDARQIYRRALDMKPGEPSILSNLGMSHLLSGDLKTSESYLTQAANAPGADSRVRQNLALVVGLQGRFQEAEQIASRELSPEQAQANVTYLRQMLSQQNAWNQLKDEEKKKTN
ncbi:tetratricopeptide repeat protein [Mesorhizobium sp. CAU 1732]|uniref:tetratricopeptide repeat protein n=1 Tax=Mesorhizobium sp. CAU 1732 TaxID=3140358 RepID=UPI003260E656